MSETWAPALRRANRVRSSRARLKRSMLDKPARIIPCLRRPPLCAAKAAVSEMLGAVPGIGPFRAKTMLRHAEIHESKRCGELTDRQKNALIAELRRFIYEPMA